MRDTSITGRPTLLLLVVLTLAVAGGIAGGAIRNVSTVSQLNSAMSSLVSGDEVVLAAGTYNLTTGFYTTVPNVTIRGATGNFNDVTVYGGGMNNASGIQQAFQFAASNETIKDLTISGIVFHAIHLQPNANNITIQGVHTLNVGDQHIKGAVPNVGGLIADCLLEQTEVRLNGGIAGRPDNYVGGIDLHGAANYVIRDNVIKNIIGISSGDGGIFLWNHSTNPTIERNIVIGGAKGIELGNPSGSSQGNWNVEGGIVRNNFIVNTGMNEGLELCYTKNVKVYNNTVYSTSANTSDWFRAIMVYDNATYPTTNLDLRNNLVRGGVSDQSTGNWSNAAVTAMGNIIDATGATVLPGWFPDPVNGNLHLTAAAAAAINAGTTLTDVLRDFDEVLRLGTYDMGADELGPHAGDANQDGHVNVDDLGILASNYDASGKYWETADFTHDYTVNVDDLGVLASNYDWASGGGSVPEPATLGLLMAATLGLLRRRR